MNKFIFLFCMALFVGCQSANPALNDFQDEVRDVEISYEEGKQKYMELRSEYINKREFAIKLIDLYYGENKDADKEDNGIQDLVYRRLDKDFSEDEQKRLIEADKKIDDLVVVLKEVDSRLKKIDEDIKDRIDDVDKSFDKIYDLIGKIKEINTKLVDLTEVITTSIKVTGEAILNE